MSHFAAPLHSPAHRPAVVTILEPSVRGGIEAAASGSFSVVHAESLDRALVLARAPETRAVLVSPAAVATAHWHRARNLVTDLPGVMPIAVLSPQSHASDRLLALGSYGVKAVVDVSQRAGYERLRELLAQAGGATASEILRQVARGFGPLTPAMREFLEVLVRGCPSLTSVRMLAAQVAVNPTSLVSRFVRSGLPSPKQYLTGLRLVYAATYLEGKDGTIASTAYRLSFASPQSFGRHLRHTLGVTPSEFKSRYTGERMLERFLASLVVPYAETMALFDPLHGLGPRQAKIRGKDVT